MRVRALGAAMILGALWLLPDSRAGAQNAVPQREIDEAIDRGVAFLRKIQGDDGHWPRSEQVFAHTVFLQIELVGQALIFGQATNQLANGRRIGGGCCSNHGGIVQGRSFAEPAVGPEAGIDS